MGCLLANGRTGPKGVQHPQGCRLYFGDAFDDFCFRGLSASGAKAEFTEGYTLEDIINGRHKTTGNDKLDNEMDEQIDFVDEAKYESIIDFPNFIMHVFKAFYNSDYRQATNNDVPLDAKYMLKVYEAIKDAVHPEEFIFRLFRSKTFFDRYIVKTIQADDREAEDNISWSLRRVKLSNRKMYFVGTFNEKGFFQDRITKALTMLQVTFRSRKYKNWLQASLVWFSGQKSLCISPEDYLAFLDAYILRRYDEYDFIGDNCADA